MSVKPDSRAGRNDFKQISKNYDEVNQGFYPTIINICRTQYFGRLKGRSVLDIGNGGVSPERIFGELLAPSITNFVGIDNSPEMIGRKDGKYQRIVGDGFTLPFPDNTFDYVLMNGIMHHLGVSRSVRPAERASHFLKEAARVAKHEVLVYEILMPRALEGLESLALMALGKASTFVLSEATLNESIARAGLAKSEVITKSLSELFHPFFWYLVFIKHPWFKLPAFLSPFSHTFFVLK
jgi:ubiquinone/menaquinone biosynthesis C-methylase UbiE